MEREASRAELQPIANASGLSRLPGEGSPAPTCIMPSMTGSGLGPRMGPAIPSQGCSRVAASSCGFWAARGREEGRGTLLDTTSCHPLAARPNASASTLAKPLRKASSRESIFHVMPHDACCMPSKSDACVALGSRWWSSGAMRCRSRAVGSRGRTGGGVLINSRHNTRRRTRARKKGRGAICGPRDPNGPHPQRYTSTRVVFLFLAAPERDSRRPDCGLSGL